jgi:hypothetical protein
MVNVKMGEFNVGDKLFIYYSENNPNNKYIEIRAIVDMEVVIYLDEKNNYHMEPIKYFNVLCRCCSLKRID